MSSVYRRTGQYLTHNIFMKINPGRCSSRKKICPQRMSWFIDSTGINNTAIMLACSRTMSYSKTVHKLEVDRPPKKRNKKTLLFCYRVYCALYCPRRPLLYAPNIQGLCACAWKVLISSMEMESGLSMHAQFQSSPSLL